MTSPGQTYVGGSSGTTIQGASGLYVLDGGVAGTGIQTLIGGPNDTLKAGTITNFNPLLDAIQLPKSEFANFAAVQSHAQQVGHNTVITYDAQETITLTGVSVSSLHASGFHFV